MTLVLVVSFAIIFVVILLSVLTINKAYTYKHTIDASPQTDEKEDHS